MTRKKTHVPKETPPVARVARYGHYYTVLREGVTLDVARVRDMRDSFDSARHASGNYYHTREEATREADRRRKAERRQANRLYNRERDRKKSLEAPISMERVLMKRAALMAKGIRPWQGSAT